MNATNHPFSHALRVRFNECDPQGIVFNANYLVYLDVLITEMWRAAVGPWSAMVEAGLDTVLASVHLDLRAPARFDDELTLLAAITRIGTTSITTEVSVTRDRDTLVDGQLRHVCVSTTTWRPIEIAPWLRAGLAPFEVRNV